MSARDLLREGSVADALAALQIEVRANPADPKLRIFLFQLLAVLGQWERALTQLNTARDMDPATLPMAQTYQEALGCEALRGEIFAGRRAPLVFGDPQQWVALLIQALALDAEGNGAQAQALRGQAMEMAPATSGQIDGQAFEWIADADARLGPLLEGVVNGNYYWIPFDRIKRIVIEEPTDLRDVVWMPVFFTWANGGEAAGFVPTRYPGSESSEDGQIQMARKTEWVERADAEPIGLGQRLLATDQSDYALMEVRDIVLETGSGEETEPEGDTGAAGG